MPEKKAQIIVEVAEAIGNQLEMSELLASLNEALTPIVSFDAISIVILEGETVTAHWAHVEGVSHQPGESVESFVDRYASHIKVDSPPMKVPVSEHPISEIMKSGEPYVASDLESYRRFDSDEALFNARFRSYIDFPLIKQGQLIVTIASAWEKAPARPRKSACCRHWQHCRHRGVECLAYEEINVSKNNYCW